MNAKLVVGLLVVVIAGFLAIGVEGCAITGATLTGKYVCRPDGTVEYEVGTGLTFPAPGVTQQDLCDRCQAAQLLIRANNRVIDNPSSSEQARAQAQMENEFAQRQLEACNECECPPQ